MVALPHGRLRVVGDIWTVTRFASLVHHAVVRRELSRLRGREYDTAGDGYFASFDGPALAIRCAQSIVEAAKREAGVDVRAGLPKLKGLPGSRRLFSVGR